MPKFDGTVLKTKSKKKRFNLILSVKEIESLIDDLPDESECFKFLSGGGFSSISFIKYVASKTKIKRLIVATLRVGKKELRCLDSLRSKGQIVDAYFIVGSLMADDREINKHYGYYENFEKICNKNEWEYVSARNHAKVILMETDKGRFVIETSSNLNENPKMEQFSFEKSDELFFFYENALKEKRSD